jgi:hypothetical protein
MLEDPPPAAESVSARAAREAADPCATGGLSEVMAARAVLAVAGEAVEWVDVEVHGAALDARSACDALVAQLERDAHAARADEDAAERLTDGGTGAARAKLEVRIERPCSSKALPVAVVDAPARLIDRRELDAVDLAIVARSADCAPVQSGLLRAVVLRQSAYPSMKQCESVRALLVEATEAANERARAQASAWLERAVAQAEQRAAARCGVGVDADSLGSPTDAGAPGARDAASSNRTIADAAAGARVPSDDEGAAPTAECERERQVLTLLAARRAGLSALQAPRDGGAEPASSDPASSVLSAPFCQPGASRGAP